MSFFKLLGSSQDLPQNQNEEVLNDKERELLHRIKKYGKEAGKDMGIGVINPKDMPNAYYNVLCFFIAYKTGTSLKHIMDMNLFDFVSYIYIVRETNPEETDNPNNPQERELNRSLGG